MSYKKLRQEHSPQELVESFVFPIKLSAKQQAAYLQLAEARQKVQEIMTGKEKLVGILMGLKFQMEDYLRTSQVL